MRIAFIREGKNNNNNNLIIDTDKKIYQYFDGAWHNPEAILVKSKKDLDKIITISKNNGYSLKVGCI